MNLTREQIINMPADREMDNLIGFHVMKIVPKEGICPDCGSDMWVGKQRYRCSNCNEWKYSLHKEYSDSIAAAWEMEEKIFEDGLAVSYISNLVYIANKENDLKVVGDWVQYYCIAHAAPHQRCRAALLAVLEAK